MGPGRSCLPPYVFTPNARRPSCAPRPPPHGPARPPHAREGKQKRDAATKQEKKELTRPTRSSQCYGTFNPLWLGSLTPFRPPVLVLSHTPLKKQSKQSPLYMHSFSKHQRLAASSARLIDLHTHTRTPNSTGSLPLFGRSGAAGWSPRRFVRGRRRTRRSLRWRTEGWGVADM